VQGWRVVGVKEHFVILVNESIIKIKQTEKPKTVDRVGDFLLTEQSYEKDNCFDFGFIFKQYL
jgi:hypothetical protein